MSSVALPLTVASEHTAAPAFRLGHRSWLDGLRGLAILAVMAYHAEPQLLARGYVGVDLFFVISGFLITARLLEEREITSEINFRYFYVRRILRLFPALALMLGAALLLMYLSPSVGQQYRSVLYSVFYVSNWFMAFNPAAVSSTLYVTWSLSIEEQFYLVWPVILCCVLRFRVRPITLMTFLLFLLALVCLHKADLMSQGASVIRIAHASDTRIDGLIIGCCVGVLAGSGLLPRIAQWIRIAIVPLCVVVVTYMLGVIAPYGAGLTVVNLFFASVLILLLVAPSPVPLALLNVRFLRWLGKLSYSLYLWHLLARFMSERLFVDRGIAWLFTIIFAIAIAATSYYIVEHPFLKLKRRFSVAF